MGFPLLEILIIAGIITISSSAIVAKVLVDLRRTGNNETELILGIIMFEDIFLAVYLSVVSGLVLGDHASFLGALTSIGIAYLLGLVFSETEHSDRIEHFVVPFRDFSELFSSSASG